jgi:predicted ester cyclase
MNVSAHNPKAIVEAFVEEYKNRHRWDCVDTYVAEDCKLHLPIPGLPPGREGMRINGRLVCTAFPDVYVTREFSVVENNIVVERAHAKATHKGELMGVAPTGNPVAWSELHAYRVHDGMIVEIWTEADFLGIMVQIGAVTMPG